MLKLYGNPRFGYKHVNQREESLFANYRTNMDPIEAKWWLSVAKKNITSLMINNI
jgi:hypothetical protein